MPFLQLQEFSKHPVLPSLSLKPSLHLRHIDAWCFVHTSSNCTSTPEPVLGVPFWHVQLKPSPELPFEHAAPVPQLGAAQTTLP